MARERRAEGPAAGLAEARTQPSHKRVSGLAGEKPRASPARANSVAGGRGTRPGQRPLPAGQDLREALHGFLAVPVALQTP